jgi:hypothetical protein
VKTIRLLLPIRVGHEIHPNNSVFDAPDDVADALLEGKDGQPCAEETDALERHPANPLTFVSDYPVVGDEKFPLPEDAEVRATRAMFRNENDRQIEASIRNASPAPLPSGKERAPAKIEATKEMKAAGEPESTSDVAARGGPPLRVEVVKEDKAKAK